MAPETATPEAEAAEAPRRADAVRNRESVIAAAEEVFGERGIEAGIPEIAERAGVGKGTVYRNFETKEDLIAAVLTKRTERFNSAAGQALEEDDAIEAFRELLVETVCGKMRNGTFMIGLNIGEGHEELLAARAQTQETLGKLMRKAIRQGGMRKDAKADDIHVLFGGVSRILIERGEQDPKVWKRHADQVVDAFRP